MDITLSDNARLFLAIMRDANRNDVPLTLDHINMLRRNIPLSDEEMTEIGDLLKADFREKNATYLAFGEINARLSRMSRDNPHGL